MLWTSQIPLCVSVWMLVPPGRSNGVQPTETRGLGFIVRTAERPWDQNAGSWGVSARRADVHGDWGGDKKNGLNFICGYRIAAEVVAHECMHSQLVFKVHEQCTSSVLHYASSSSSQQQWKPCLQLLVMAMYGGSSAEARLSVMNTRLSSSVCFPKYLEFKKSKLFLEFSVLFHG